MKQSARIDQNSSRRYFLGFSTSAAIGAAAVPILSPLLTFQRPVVGRNSKSLSSQIATIFAPNSFWYTPIPTNVPLHPNSANFVADFLRQKTSPSYYTTVGINTTFYTSPVYLADAGTATVPVTEWHCMDNGFPHPQLAQQWSAVPIPSNAEPEDPFDNHGNPTDREMTIYQPSTDTMWEFWNTRKVNGQWQACWGGRMQNVSQNPGIWDNPYGGTATGLPYLGGQITAEELQRGEITHVMGIALVDVESFDIYSWPANRSDGYNPTHEPNRIPEGLRFRLDPSVNVDALQMHPIGKIIAKAAQKYGFVVWDKAGAITLRAQNPKSYTQLGQPDPYVALFNGTPTYAILEGLPWDRLQFMPIDYGRIADVIPPAGRTSGGQQIKLVGSFANLSGVKIGGNSATWSYTNGPGDTSMITVTTPAHTVGAVNIVLTPTSGSPYTKTNAFAYLPTSFTNDTLVAGVTTAKAQHIIELRQAVDALRAVAGQVSASWANSTLSPASTVIKAVHITELRTNLENVAVLLGYPAATYTDQALGSGVVIKRVHIEELRQRIRNIAGS
jgi:hypothetical protein